VSWQNTTCSATLPTSWLLSCTRTCTQGREAALKPQVSELRSQLSQATAELHESRTQLHAALDTSQQLQSLLAATSAAKAALERRVGALKLLLAEQVGENAGLVQGLKLCQEGLEAARLQLEQADAQQVAARAEIASKVRGCRHLRSISGDARWLCAWCLTAVCVASATALPIDMMLAHHEVL
jgi:chromosome segregation ATPase